MRHAKHRYLWTLGLALYGADLSAARFTVVGIDRTDSLQDMTRAALRLAEPYFWQAQPGDQVVGRWISDRSYAEDQTLVRLELPEPAALPQVRNRFDAVRQAAHRGAAEAHAREILVRKTAALRVLRAQCVGATPSTDLAGFVMAASEILTQRAGAYADRWLVVLTDLEDNRGFKVAPRLDGVHVEVQLVGREANPEKVERLRLHWTQRFTSWGAAEVRVIRPILPAAQPSTREDKPCSM